MEFVYACVAVGILFVVMALAGSVLKRLPLTTSLLYLAFGFALGGHGLGLVRLDPFRHSALLERLTEVAVIIALFATGLKLRVPLRDRRWLLPIRLAFGSMMLTVGLVTAAGVVLLGLPVGAAVLLGAVLAPTDPVLAADVAVEHPSDADRLRFSLTGEAGFNDGTAFPFVMLGLGLLGLHELGDYGWRWLVVDVLWAISAGMGIGWALGCLIGHLVLYLRRQYREAVGLDDFLALGLIALSYGLALLAHSYGFLAVFMAGLALRHVEMGASGTRPPEDVIAAGRAAAADEIATDPETAPAYMAQAVLGFNEQLDRIAAAGLVVLVGGMIWVNHLTAEVLWFIPVLLLVIRPAAVSAGLVGSRTTLLQRRLVAWFGIRGLGSLYYLMFAIQHGLPEPLAQRLIAVTLVTIAVSVIVHGLSVTPLMDFYTRRMERGARRKRGPMPG